MASSKKKDEKNRGGRAKGNDGVTPLKARPDGKKLWRARLYWIDPRSGKHCEKRVVIEATSKVLAQVKRAQLVDELKDGYKRERVAFVAASDAWFETIKAPATRNHWGCHKRKLDARFGNLLLDQVTAREIRADIDQMNGTPGYRNSRLDVATHILDFGIEKGWLEVNVARDVKKRSTRNQGLDELGERPRRALTAEETAAYLSALRETEPEIYPVVLTQLVLGCRFAEVSALLHADIDWEKGLVKIRRGQVFGQKTSTKGKYARTAALPRSAREVLKAHIERMAELKWPEWDVLVFPRPPFNSKPRKSNHWVLSTACAAVGRALEKAGVTGVSGKTHIARHTLITLTTGHVAEGIVQKVVGHKSAAIHDQYQYAHEADVIDFAEAVVARQVLRETGIHTGTAPNLVSKKRGK